jgi:hypothetical protein
MISREQDDKVFSWDAIKKLEMQKEDMYRLLNGKQVTAIFTESGDIKMFGLKDSDGKIFIIDEMVNY